MSYFGESNLCRRRYYLLGEGNYHPLDEHLNLPKKSLSYSLQSLLGQNSTESDYRTSVHVLNTLLPINLSGTHSKRIVEEIAPLVRDYYEEKPALNEVSINEEGSFLAFGNDGKGVPIVKAEREDKGDKERGRLMKGQKRGIKKQATVAVSFSFNPIVRNSESILRGLFRETITKIAKGETQIDEKDRRLSKNVHKRAFMCDQKKAIDYAITNLKNRNPQKTKPIIALVDCGVGLEQGILDSIASHGLSNNLEAIIADIVHVSEYIWKAANAILGEKFRGRSDWVRSVMKDILESKTEKVIKDLKANIEKTTLSDKKRVQIEKTIKYLTNHQHKMNYKTYLEKGYPISTGLIEGCCGHLIKDRMEHSGMRWTIQGAQNMIDLRSVNKNRDWKDFMTFVRNTKQSKKLVMSK